MKPASEIALAQVTLFLSGLFLLMMLGLPSFGFDWLMAAFFFLALAVVGFRTLTQLWRSEDTRNFLRSVRLMPVLFGAICVSFVVGSGMLFWDLALVGLKKSDLFSVDKSATFGFALVILSLALGFVLSLFEAVWRSRLE